MFCWNQVSWSIRVGSFDLKWVTNTSVSGSGSSRSRTWKFSTGRENVSMSTAMCSACTSERSFDSSLRATGKSRIHSGSRPSRRPLRTMAAHTIRLPVAASASSSYSASSPSWASTCASASRLQHSSNPTTSASSDLSWAEIQTAFRSNSSSVHGFCPGFM